MNLRQRSLISKYSFDPRMSSRAFSRTPSSSSCRRSFLPLSTSTWLFIALLLSRAESRSQMSLLSCYRSSFSALVRQALSCSLSACSSWVMWCSRNDCRLRVLSSQLIFSRNSTCLRRYYFSLSSFLFSTASCSLPLSSSWISRMRQRRSWSPLRRFSRSSSSCSLSRSHSPSRTLFCVSSISILMVRAFSSRLVLVRVQRVLRDFWSLRSSTSELLKLSTKLMASSCICPSRIDNGSPEFRMYCGPRESSRDRFESIDRSRSDRFLVNFLGLSSWKRVTFFAVFSPEKINFQLIYQLLFPYNNFRLALVCWARELSCLCGKRQAPFFGGWTGRAWLREGWGQLVLLFRIIINLSEKC